VNVQSPYGLLPVHLPRRTPALASSPQEYTQLLKEEATSILTQGGGFPLRYGLYAVHSLCGSA